MRALCVVLVVLLALLAAAAAEAAQAQQWDATLAYMRRESAVPTKREILEGNKEAEGTVLGFKGWVVENVPETDRLYSSVLNNSRLGRDYARSKLGSEFGWSARFQEIGQWMSIRLSKEKFVRGVVVQSASKGLKGRELVRLVSFQKSHDCQTYTNVDQGADYLTHCEANSQDKQLVTFKEPVKAKCIKIVVKKWSLHPTMRAALSTTEDQLAYTMANVEEKFRSYSSVLKNSTAGDLGYERSKINSPTAWRPRYDAYGEWMAIHLPKEHVIQGAYIQGHKRMVDENGRLRPHSLECALQVSFEYSPDCKTYWPVDGSEKYWTNSDGKTDRWFLLTFQKPVKAKCIKIKVWKWQKHIAMRAALAIAHPNLPAL